MSVCPTHELDLIDLGYICQPYHMINPRVQWCSNRASKKHAYG